MYFYIINFPFIIILFDFKVQINPYLNKITLLPKILNIILYDQFQLFRSLKFIFIIKSPIFLFNFCNSLFVNSLNYIIFLYLNLYCLLFFCIRINKRILFLNKNKLHPKEFITANDYISKI